MEPFVRLREEIGEALLRRGLKLNYVGFVPGEATGAPHFVQIVAVLADPEPTKPDPDDRFEEVVRSARAAELEGRKREVIDDLARRLGDGGFL